MKAVTSLMLAPLSLHGQGLFAQPGPAAVGAGPQAHVLLDILPHLGRVGLVIAFLEQGHHPGKGPGAIEAAAALLIEKIYGAPLGAEEQGLLDLPGQILKRGVDGKVVVLLQGLQHLLVPEGMAVGPGPHRAFPQA